VDSLLGAMREQSRPIKPKALGIIGSDHLRRVLAFTTVLWALIFPAASFARTV
jgi:hypothetical protein